LSKVTETIKFEYPVNVVSEAIRRASIRAFSPIAESGNVISIRLKTKRTLLTPGTPATVTMELRESKKTAGVTKVLFVSSNFGAGPLQIRECRKKLDAVKELIFAELEIMRRENTVPGTNYLIVENGKSYRSKKLKSWKRRCETN
jgi:hypothetical protein